VAVAETIARETRLSEKLHELIMAYKRENNIRFKVDAIRQLIDLSRQIKSVAEGVRYRDHFDENAKRYGFSVSAEADEEVQRYCNSHDITFQLAYFEFICRGLHVWRKRAVL